MLSLVVFMLSLAFTFVLLNQYLEMKHSEVGAVDKRLGSLRVLDELCGTPGWMSGRTDWENIISSLDLSEKVGDKNFFLGLRKNDRFPWKNILIPGTGDVFQSAPSSSIDDAVSEIGNSSIPYVAVNGQVRAEIIVNTSMENSSIVLSPDNATTHVGWIYAGAPLRVLVTDLTPDGQIVYDSILVSGQTARENEFVMLAGRNFSVSDIDLERVVLTGPVSAAYLLPNLDDHEFSVASGCLESRGVKFLVYQRIVSGQAGSLEYTLFSRAPNKYVGDVAQLSLRKIQAMGSYVPYDVAKTILGVSGEFHLTIRRVDGQIILDYGPTVPAETERSEREALVEGVRCIVAVDIW